MKSTSINHAVDRRLMISTYILVLLSIAAFANMDNNPGIFLFAIASMLTAWLVVEVRGGKAVPQYALNLVVLGAAVLFWHEVSAILSQGLIISLGHFMIVLILCKLFEKKTTRDLVQVIVLAYMLIIATTMLFSSSFGFALILAGFEALLVYTVIVLNMRFDRERHAGQPGVVSVLPVPHAELRRLDLDLKRITWQTWALLIPLTGILFLVLPRTRNSGYLTSLGTDASIRTGYTDLVQFHEFGQLTQSDAVVMTVTLKHNRENVGSEIYLPYFRGRPVDNYNGNARQWTSSPALENTYKQVPVTDRHIAELDTGSGNDSGLISQEYTLYNAESGTLFTLAPASKIYLYDDPRSRAIFYSEQAMSARLTGMNQSSIQYIVYTPLAPDPDTFVGKASVVPGNLGGQVVSDEVPTQGGATRATTEPATQPDNVRPIRGRNGNGTRNTRTILTMPQEITDLAHHVPGLDLLPGGPTESPKPENIKLIAARFENYLRTNYPYSLNSVPVDPNKDPTVDFLLNRQKTGGSCEYFASAMVFLCRAVGINARGVAGYIGTEFNVVSMSYVVRTRDAHMWAEYFVPGEGWISSDPSPSSVGVTTAHWPVTRWLTDIMQAMENVWMSTVVSFDNDSRASVISSLLNEFRTVWDDIHGIFAAFRLGLTGGAGPKEMGNFILFLVGSGVLAGWVTWRWRRDGLLPGAAQAAHRSGRLTGDLAFMDELFGLIGQNGVARRNDQTPHEFALANRSVLGSHITDAQWLIQTYYTLRFGMTKADASLRTQVAIVLKQLKQGLHDSQSVAQAPAN